MSVSTSGRTSHQWKICIAEHPAMPPVCLLPSMLAECVPLALEQTPLLSLTSYQQRVEAKTHSLCVSRAAQNERIEGYGPQDELCIECLSQSYLPLQIIKTDRQELVSIMSKLTFCPSLTLVISHWNCSYSFLLC